MTDNKNNHNKSFKVEKKLYRVRNPKRRIQINVNRHLMICNHKGRWVVAFTHSQGWDSGFFENNETINRTEALKMISFLSDYVNLVKPTQATALNASIKVSANRIKSNAAQLVGLVIKEQEND